jgi:hypothetical protein
VPPYLNPEHPRYSPKLAAAVSAWLAYEGVPGRSPKQTLTKWIEGHAEGFGLTDKNNSPQPEAINEVAKVANWQRSGGAPSTPSG